jgi:hypothetical protein
VAIVIDGYSLTAVRLEMRFRETRLAVGTGFIWKVESKLFLITNWHNVTGINPQDGSHISQYAGEPDAVVMLVHPAADRLGDTAEVRIPLRGQQGEPLWLEHPSAARKVDVVALPLPSIRGAIFYPINEMPQMNMLVTVGLEAFILGYPFGISVSTFPVWKRASIASEPDVFVKGQHYFFVDTASRQGMSGSPVILRTWGGYHTPEGGLITASGSATRFIGIYSGRIGGRDEFQAQLGMVWRVGLIDVIVKEGRPGSLA